MHNKQILFIFSQAPYQGSLAQSGLDNLLAHASFECQCYVLFIHHGLAQLTKTQLVPSHAKNIYKQIQALPLYDVDKIYAATQSADTFSDTLSNTFKLPSFIKTATTEKMNALIKSADIIYTY